MNKVTALSGYDNRMKLAGVLQNALHSASAAKRAAAEAQRAAEAAEKAAQALNDVVMSMVAETTPDKENEYTIKLGQIMEAWCKRVGVMVKPEEAEDLLLALLEV